MLGSGGPLAPSPRLRAGTTRGAWRNAGAGAPRARGPRSILGGHARIDVAGSVGVARDHKRVVSDRVLLRCCCGIVRSADLDRPHRRRRRMAAHPDSDGNKRACGLVSRRVALRGRRQQRRRSRVHRSDRGHRRMDRDANRPHRRLHASRVLFLSLAVRCLRRQRQPVRFEQPDGRVLGVDDRPRRRDRLHHQRVVRAGRYASPSTTPATRSARPIRPPARGRGRHEGRPPDEPFGHFVPVGDALRGRWVRQRRRRRGGHLDRPDRRHRRLAGDAARKQCPLP